VADGAWQLAGPPGYLSASSGLMDDLAEVKSQGIFTDAEFQTQKEEILGQYSGLTRMGHDDYRACRGSQARPRHRPHGRRPLARRQIGVFRGAEDEQLGASRLVDQRPGW